MRRDFLQSSWTADQLLFVSAAFCGTLSAVLGQTSTDGG